jgi:hypothetical protein
VAEQPEKAATSEVLTEEDDGGESRGPASLAGAAGRFLVQEVCGDEALPLVWSDSSEMAHRRWVKCWPVWSRAARSVTEQWKSEAE